MFFAKKINKYINELGNKWRLFRFNMIEKPQFKSFGNIEFVGKDCTFFNKQYISIGKNFSTLHRIRLDAIEKYYNQQFTPQIVIGDNVNFNSDVHIGCIDKIVIGNNVLFASRIYVSDHYHGEINSEALRTPPSERPLYSPGPVIIEDNVWIGEGVCILPNVTIGKNSIIGANAVVNKSFPANSVIAGVPAKLIKTL